MSELTVPQTEGDALESEICPDRLDISVSSDGRKASPAETTGENPAENSGESPGGSPKEDREEKTKRVPPQPQVPERPLEDVTRFKLKVGKILKIWHHEDADSLFCEEIDLGEAAPRQILSGLRSFYQAEELEGERVIVLCNMKEKNLRGKKSQGMVMCASTADHTQVEVLVPPATSIPGDRVTFEGLSDELGPDEVLSVKKNKDPLPHVLPHFKTNSNKEACWKGHKMLINGEVCVSKTLADANVT